MNWWTMRLACSGDGTVDPARLLAVRQLGFRDIYEAHLTQDALDEMREIAREDRG